ncbi:MAG: hypothetical protein O3A01_08375 [bacterium]|nr:hypothetical protein [bacterium]
MQPTQHFRPESPIPAAARGADQPAPQPVDFARMFAHQDVQAQLGNLFIDRPDAIIPALTYIQSLSLDSQATPTKILGEAMAHAMMTENSDEASYTTQFVTALSVSPDFTLTSPAWRVLMEQEDPAGDLNHVLTAYSRQFGNEQPMVTNLRNDALIAHAVRQPSRAIYGVLIGLPNGIQLLRTFIENPAWHEDLHAVIQQYRQQQLADNIPENQAEHCAYNL